MTMDKMMDLAAARPHMRRTEKTASPNQQPIAQTNNAALQTNRVRTSHMAAGRTLSNRYHRPFHVPPTPASSSPLLRTQDVAPINQDEPSQRSQLCRIGRSRVRHHLPVMERMRGATRFERSRSHGGVKACRQAGTRYFT
jgi:hypothetical protein